MQLKCILEVIVLSAQIKLWRSAGLSVEPVHRFCSQKRCAKNVHWQKCTPAYMVNPH